MVIERIFLPAAFSIIVSASCLAVPTGRVNFTPPLKSAKTIQVTETIWEAGDGSTPGPLRKAGTITFCIARPDKFRVEMKSGSPPKVTDSYVSDGETLVGLSGGRTRTQPAQRAEWPFPVMGLLNNAPGPVSAVPAVRDGKQVLLTIRVLGPTGRQEAWFDPSTHLLIRDMMFMTWQGKTSEVMRTEYAGWILNKPLAASVFRVPSVGTHHKS